MPDPKRMALQVFDETDDSRFGRVRRYRVTSRLTGGGTIGAAGSEAIMA
jgi:hypothetical protein